MPADTRDPSEQDGIRRALEDALVAVAGNAAGLGVDVQLISEINIDNPNFLERNFTPAEVAYCRSAPDPHASFAGRWAAKEAVVKAKMNVKAEGKNYTRGGGAPLIEIEILPGSSGAPTVVQHGRALENAREIGIAEIKVSISHSGDYVAAVALAFLREP